ERRREEIDHQLRRALLAVEGGGVFHDLERAQARVPGDAAEDSGGLRAAQPIRYRQTYAGHIGGIEAVEVDSKTETASATGRDFHSLAHDRREAALAHFFDVEDAYAKPAQQRPFRQLVGADADIAEVLRPESAAADREELRRAMTKQDRGAHAMGIHRGRRL